MLKNWRKKGLVFLVVILCLTLFVGCNSKKGELSSAYDQAKVEEMGQKVIELVNTQDYQAIRDMGIQEIKDTLTDDAMAKVEDKLQKYGEYKGITKTQVFGYTEEDVEYAVYTAKTKYGKRQVTYSLAFDKDMKLVGFSVK